MIGTQFFASQNRPTETKSPAMGTRNKEEGWLFFLHNPALEKLQLGNKLLVSLGDLPLQIFI
jgi:hypothetical protein